MNMHDLTEQIITVWVNFINFQMLVVQNWVVTWWLKIWDNKLKKTLLCCIQYRESILYVDLRLGSYHSKYIVVFWLKSTTFCCYSAACLFLKSYCWYHLMQDLIYAKRSDIPVWYLWWWFSSLAKPKPRLKEIRIETYKCVIHQEFNCIQSRGRRICKKGRSFYLRKKNTHIKTHCFEWIYILFDIRYAVFQLVRSKYGNFNTGKSLYNNSFKIKSFREKLDHIS